MYKIAILVVGDPKLPHRGVGEGATPFPGLFHFILDPYLIILSVKQSGIKYHFLVSQTFGDHSTH